MFNLLLKKIVANIYYKKILILLKKIFEQKNVRLPQDMLSKIPKEHRPHVKNLLILIFSYTTSSLIIYPHFAFGIFLREIFALLCIYGAIYISFLEKIEESITFKVFVGASALLCPIIFINNTPMVALVAILVFMICEFIAFEYARGCKLFSSKIPVYIIFDNGVDDTIAKKILAEYKVLELVVLESSNECSNVATLRSIENLKTWIRKISFVPFYPTPKRLIYFSQKINADRIIQLANIAAEFSLPLYKGAINIDGTGISVRAFPISFSDFDHVCISSQEKTALSSCFKNKKIWAYYDGRGCVLDLIYAFTTINSIDLTILCESEMLFLQAEQYLSAKSSSKNWQIKIMNLDVLDALDTVPDMLFYNIPIKSNFSGENNLKEALIKNVLNTQNLIKYAQNKKIPHVFVLSGNGAINATNWIGATQRLGELFVQFADSNSRKTSSKFRIIRIPESATDVQGLLGNIIASVLANGEIHIDFINTETYASFYRKDILPILIKSVISIYKAHDASSTVYTILPKNNISLNDLINKACNIVGLRRDKDVSVIYNSKTEALELDNFPNISEPLEETNMENVYCTKFSYVDELLYLNTWSIEQIYKMSTRDLISAVFQSLSEKIKTKSK